MSKKAAEIFLIIFIAATAVFIVTFMWFLDFKQRACAVSLYSGQCYEQFPAFLHNELHL